MLQDNIEASFDSPPNNITTCFDLPLHSIYSGFFTAPKYFCFPLFNTVARFDWPLYYIAESFYFPMYNRESRITSVLKSGEVFESRKYLREFEAKIENILGGLSGPQLELFMENQEMKNLVVLSL